MAECGYSEAASLKKAHTIWKRPEVVEYIEAKYNSRMRKIEITEDRIMEEYAKIAFSNEGDLLDVDPETGELSIDWKNLTPEMRAKISGFKHEINEKETFGVDTKGEVVRTITRTIKVEPKFADKLRALSDLSKIKGMLTEKIELNGVEMVARLQAGREQARLNGPRVEIEAEFSEVKENVER